MIGSPRAAATPRLDALSSFEEGTIFGPANQSGAAARRLLERNLSVETRVMQTNVVLVTRFCCTLPAWKSPAPVNTEQF